MAELVNQIEYIEKKSKFIGYYFACKTVEDVNFALAELKSLHKKATHICYAYSLKNPFLEKAVDDGEPGGTAGRPILSVLQKRGVSDACVFVVRYFGGIKLGAGGLVRAYTKTTSEVLK
ncbi:MAG: IMPACT family protein [Candidatus Caccovivens sp.]